MLLRSLSLKQLPRSATTTHKPIFAPKPISNQVGSEVVNNSWIEISRSALEYNLQKTRSLLGRKAILCAVLKGNAYGHNLPLITAILIENNVQCIGAATNQEFSIIRQLGFKGRLIRIRNATEKEMAQATNYHVEELIGSLEMAQKLSTIAKQQQKTISFHLGLNSTGISRNGLELKENKGIQIVKQIIQLPAINLIGLMSHYPENKVAKINQDLALFHQQTQQIFAQTAITRETVELHIANSFAAKYVSGSRLDMVRVGNILYGNLIECGEFKHVMSFKGSIASINHYPKGNTIGYERTYTLTRDSVLANIPVGYANGYQRVFSHKAYVLIGGHRVPILGNTSMNTIVADITDFTCVKSGDEVVFFGKQGNAEINSADIEKMSGLFFPEVSIIWGATNPHVLVD